MNKIIACVGLDMINAKSFKKSCILCGVLFFALALLSCIPAFYVFTILLLGLAPVWGFFHASDSFVLEEKDHMDMLYITLPLYKKSVVWGRYLFLMGFLFLLFLFGLFLSLGSSVISRIIAGGQTEMFSLEQLLGIHLGLFFLCTLILLFQLPFYFAFPYSEVRMWLYSPFFLMGIPPVILSKIPILDMRATVISVCSFCANHTLHAVCIVFAFWLVALLISCALSGMLYAKRFS